MKLIKMNLRVLILIVLACLCAACGNTVNIGPHGNAKADKVILSKEDRRLYLMSGDRVLKTYKVALGGNPTGPKRQEGDGKTPEGSYFIDRRNPNSAFHLSLHISYPSAADVRNAERTGVKPGGDIMIHGLRNGLGWLVPLHRLLDWTQGCIAVTNGEIEEIWALVPDGTPIELRP